MNNLNNRLISWLVLLWLDAPTSLYFQFDRFKHVSQQHVLAGTSNELRLVPGWQQTAACYNKFMSQLQLNVHVSHISVAQTKPWWGHVEPFQHMLHRNTAWLESRLRNPAPLTFFGISRGGLYALHEINWLVEQGYPVEYIRLITVATPWHGAPLASVLPGVTAQEMRVNSASLQQLHTRLELLQQAGLHVQQYAYYYDAVVPYAKSGTQAKLLPHTAGHLSWRRQSVQQQLIEIIGDILT